MFLPTNPTSIYSIEESTSVVKKSEQEEEAGLFDVKGNGGVVKCNQCKQTFTRKQNLTQHIKNDICCGWEKYCSQNFVDCNTVLEHLENCGCGNSSTEHICEQCGLTYSSEESLGYHKYFSCPKRSEIRVYRCMLCNRKFTRLYGLKKHACKK